MLMLNFILVQTDAAKQYSRTHLMKTWHDEKHAEKKNTWTRPWLCGISK